MSLLSHTARAGFPTTIRDLFYIRGKKICHILLKQFHLVTLDINIVKHPWFSHCTWKNRVMFERRSVDFKTISVSFLLTHTVAEASALYRYRLSEIDAWNIRFDSRFILSYFLNHFIFHVIKGTIKNACPCIVEIRGRQGYALVGDLTKEQPLVPLISTMHGQPFLISLTNTIGINQGWQWV